MTRLLGGWLKVSRTLWSTKPTDDLDEGLELRSATPVVAFLATRLKNEDERGRRAGSAKNIESTLIAKKLPWHSFQTQAPSFLQTVRFWRW